VQGFVELPKVAKPVECFLSYTTIIHHSKGTGQLDLFGAPVGAVPVVNAVLVVNADGSVKGCTLIYASAGAAS
jgi:hypothetical protein